MMSEASNTNFYDPYLLQPSLCIYPYTSQPPSPAAVYDPPPQFAFPLPNCTPHTFTFSPTGIQGSVQWQTVESVHDAVLTPTNVAGAFTEFGAVAAATPEFIHPRNSNVPQWLMSPPVGDQDPSIISYAPLNTPTHTTPVSERLLTPDDFIITPQLQPEQIIINMLERNKNSLVDVSRADSGISSPLSVTQPVENKSETFVKQMFDLTKRCNSLDEFQREIKEFFPHEVCLSLLSCLLHFSLSRVPSHECLLQKLSTTDSRDVSAVLFNKDSPKKIFPIGVFWDIENCQVPSGKSAMAIVQKIRRQFFNDHAEAEFMAVCDINKESRHVIQDLNNAQVNVIHVNAVAKNAADDKLRQSIRRYAQTHTAPATVVLITGDCNFTSEVSDLRHRHKYFVVLMHPVNSSKALVEAANTSVLYEDFVADLPLVCVTKDPTTELQVVVMNLPTTLDLGLIRGRLKQISENCGGKVVHVNPPTAVIKFSNEDLLRRSLKRLNGEMVHGCKISVQRKTSDLSALSKHFTPRRKSSQQVCDLSCKLCLKIYFIISFDILDPQEYWASNQQNEHHYIRQLWAKVYNISMFIIFPCLPPDTGVQLTISNIDAQLGVKVIQETILSLITQHTQVWKLQIRPHNRFTVMCDVVVPDVESASTILQSLHRRKLGGKRILVTISQRLEDEQTLLKKELMPLMKEFASNGIKFNELMSLYAQSYHKTLKLGQLKVMKDLVILREINDIPFIYMVKNDGNPMYSVCKQHFRHDRTQMRHPIKLEIGLREFCAKLHALLHSHDGSIYLNSFEQCYLSEFGSFPYPQDGSGVFLEHQISYVPGVQIMEGDVKTVVWSQPHSDNGSDTASETSTSSRSKSSSLVNFAREMVDLLKTFPYCCLPCHDIMLAYQRHYGHALRINGFTNISDMLFSIPHVVQIMGPSNNHLLTLTHRAQVKRFTQEIIKLLKASPDKAILVAQLPDMYFRTFERVWNLRDYGVSVLSDILDDIPDGNIGVSGEGDNIVMSLPTRERTSEEIQRTNLFSRELVEILRLRHRCRMSFTEFVPAYHRQFGRQCKLSNYGFNKLLDLFESLPRVVQVVEDAPEKYLQLTTEEQLKVLTSQIVGLLRQQVGEAEGDGIPLNRIQSMYSHKYGFPLVPRYYDCDDIQSLIILLSHAVKLTKSLNNELVVKQSERKPIRLLCAQLLVLLLDMNNDYIDMDRLQQAYTSRYNESITPSEYGFISMADVVRKSLSGIARFGNHDGETMISLKAIYQRAKRIRSILLLQGGTMTLGEFNQSYKSRYGEPLDVEQHGFRTCEGMLRALSLVLVVKGFGIKKTLVLRNHMQRKLYADGPLSSSMLACGDVLDIQINNTTQSSKPRPLQEILSSMKSPKPHDKPTKPTCLTPTAKYSDVVQHTNEMDRKYSSNIPPAAPRQYKDIFYKQPYTKPRFNFDVANHSPFIYPTNPPYCHPVTHNTRSLPSQPNNPPRRRISVSVITLPNGTTSISSNSSPDSFLSTDEDSKISPDELLRHNDRPAPPQLRLAASFTATPL
ncbi:meiosis regulator and mRNA stability factor 1-like [Ciona intestinalis]